MINIIKIKDQEVTMSIPDQKINRFYVIPEYVLGESSAYYPTVDVINRDTQRAHSHVFTNEIHKVSNHDYQSYLYTASFVGNSIIVSKLALNDVSEELIVSINFTEPFNKMSYMWGAKLFNLGDRYCLLLLPNYGPNSYVHTHSHVILIDSLEKSYYTATSDTHSDLIALFDYERCCVVNEGKHMVVKLGRMFSSHERRKGWKRYKKSALDYDNMGEESIRVIKTSDVMDSIIHKRQLHDVINKTFDLHETVDILEFKQEKMLYVAENFETNSTAIFCADLNEEKVEKLYEVAELFWSIRVEGNDIYGVIEDRNEDHTGEWYSFTKEKTIVIGEKFPLYLDEESCITFSKINEDQLLFEIKELDEVSIFYATEYQYDYENNTLILLSK
ncbi:hypothetical protein NQ117_09860 [Paenibacillus sp. SC116]|uniref:hypothetical protein n=1 Tax=Paenibacillus sp. SC116 TaxID=2968986 RepID=UPI00215B3FD8|nr:hypothetical protein [Paenibacillus sp. SC116]MCR8843994.1 hypothetical protein [Paenibacillus sp. SC116]